MGARCGKASVDYDDDSSAYDDNDEAYEDDNSLAEGSDAARISARPSSPTGSYEVEYDEQVNAKETVKIPSLRKTHVRRDSNYNDIHRNVSEELNKLMDNASYYDHGRPMGVVGLQNLGNTCFLNSSVQCLSATIPLTDYFLGCDYKSEINKGNFLGTSGKLATAYAKLLRQMWLGTEPVVQPIQFKKQMAKFAPQFSGNFQHDSQELLSSLLDGIHEDLNRVKKKPYIEDKDCTGKNDEADAIEAWKNYLRRNKSLVVDLFQGQLRNTCQCSTCGFRNIRFEPFMYLSLPISDSCRTLEDCLDLYISVDELHGDNQWYCSKCKRHRDATKKIDLWILPPILIIHLKRFRYNDFGQVGSKNDAPIRFPLEKWDLSNVQCSRGGVKPLYDLYALSNHMGSLRSGHYTACSLTRFDEQWVEFNDSIAQPVNKSRILSMTSMAYLLFYNRSEGDAERYPLVRRQSVSRPDLWPHTQEKETPFREYTRQTSEILRSPGSPPTSPGVLSSVSSPRTASSSNKRNGKKKKHVKSATSADMSQAPEPPISPRGGRSNGTKNSKGKRYAADSNGGKHRRRAPEEEYSVEM